MVAMYAQRCQRGFSVKITDFPMMACVVNHVTEDLQHGILRKHLQILLIALS